MEVFFFLKKRREKKKKEFYFWFLTVISSLGSYFAEGEAALTVPRE